jgi:hypothetical protein
MFSSMETQGLRAHEANLWGLWTIHPDGTNWAPLVSAFGAQPADSFHFQTQLSDGQVVVEEYYLHNNQGFGTYWKLPPRQPKGQPAFGPADPADPRNAVLHLPFSPLGVELLTRFAGRSDGAAIPSVPDDPKSTRVGKVTHPSGAPDNHLLTVWSPGPINYRDPPFVPAVDAGIYLLKSGQPVDEPGQMLLIKNDPRYNEQWPRALVPYKRIYGVDEPERLPWLANDGKRSPHLPEGTPFGLIGTSSLYKRESYPSGSVPKGSVTATSPGAKGDGLDPFNTVANGASLNWEGQGGDAGWYQNSDIHAIHILVMEPTTSTHRVGPKSERLFYNHAQERLRILGEIPVRKFGAPGASSAKGQPLDPDHNPDTSFLAKIPADVVFSLQTLDKDGMVLNMAQTWHQLRPGEIRNNCGGCHAHSQKPTLFEQTAAAKPTYKVFDLTQQTPLLTTKANDQSGRRWDTDDRTGLRFEKGIKNVEYFRDVKPILERSCIACHTQKWDKPAGNLVLDDDGRKIATPGTGVPDLPASYYRLARDNGAKFGHKPLIGSWRQSNYSRYIRGFQSRRSLLVWKIFGKRTDGFDNDDFPHETVPGDANTLVQHGKLLPASQRDRAHLIYNGKPMPPPEAVAGTYEGPAGQKIKVQPLSDEDRRTVVRWIDLGCPIDLDYDPAKPNERGHGWMLDDNRPTLSLTYPRPGANDSLGRILVGMHDVYTGLDLDSFRVTADFPIDGMVAGENLAPRFKALSENRWELTLQTPITALPEGTLTVAVKDRQGNWARIERTFSVGRTTSGQ